MPTTRLTEASDLSTHHLGVVGAGQLARMAAEAASALGLSVAVLAESPADAACAVAAEVLLGSPLVEANLRSLAERSEVLTFDHEQVDLTALRALADDGVVIRPGRQTLKMAVDKAHMRAMLVRAGIPVPAHVAVDLSPNAASPATEAIERFGAEHGWPLVLKTARGGYDGKGVWPADDMDGVGAVVAGLAGTLLVEEMVPLTAELAVMVARRPDGDLVTWPAVETAQVGGVCREVLVPGRLPSELVDQARILGQRVAEISGAVGVLAVELFWRGGRCWSTRSRPGPTTRVTGRWRGRSPPSSRTTCGPSSTCPSGPPHASTRRWPASTSSGAATVEIPWRSSPVPWPFRALMSTCMARWPEQGANWGT